ncbi:MAG: DUF3987 domain-containing protein [bacterium]|nr:DUF3987 domain-containing protein [bacterium]
MTDNGWAAAMAKVKATQAGEVQKTGGTTVAVELVDSSDDVSAGGNAGVPTMPEGYANIQAAMWELLQDRGSAVALSKVNVTPGVWHRAPLKGEKDRISYKLLLKGQRIMALIDRHIYGEELEKVPLTLDGKPIEDRFTPEDLQKLEKLSREEEENDRKNKLWLADYGRKLQGRLSKPIENQPYLKAKGLSPEDIPGCLQFGNVEDYWFRLPYGDRKWLCLPWDGLFIPIYSEEGSLQGFQTIEAKRGEDGKFAKRTFGEATGGRLVFPGKDGEKGPLILLEGAATAASTHRHTGYECFWCVSAKALKERALEARRRWPERPIIIGADNDMENERNGKGNAGRKAAEDAVKAVSGAVAVAMCPAMDGKNTDFNDWDVAGQADVIRAVINNAVEEALTPNGVGTVVADDGPIPLRRPPEKQEPYPTGTFFEFAQTVVDVATYTDSPQSMVGSTILAALSLMSMPLANVRTTQFITPLSLFMLTVGETGDGKTTVESILFKKINETERVLIREYENRRKEYEIEQEIFENDLKQLQKKKLTKAEYVEQRRALEESRPIAPVEPVLVTCDMNIEGLYKSLRYALPWIGLITDEGGRLFGGTAFAKENAVKTIANLSSVWSGKPLDKMRYGEGASKIYDRRVCASIMIQPVLAQDVYGNELYASQGFLCRFLHSWPEPLMKLSDHVDVERLQSVQDFYRACERLLGLQVRQDPDSGGILFDELALDDKAQTAWKSFKDDVEHNRGRDKKYEAVNGYAKRAAEQALRIAGCLSMAHDPASRVIGKETMEAGIVLAQWYLDEILRIALDDMTSPEILQAENLLHWLWEKAIKRTSVRQVLQFGPNALREKAKVEKAFNTLIEHRWLIPIEGGAEVWMGEGKPASFARNAWTVRDDIPA